MTIVLLAGGISKRMWPIKQDKLLLDFLGKPLFQHVLEQTYKTKLFDNYIIIGNPNNLEQLKQITAKVDVQADFVIQSNAQGMADALLSAENLIQGEVLVVNADDLVEPNVFQEIINQVQSSQSDVLITGLVRKQYFPGGYLKLEGEKVIGVVEKPGEGNEPSNVMKLVLDYFRDGSQLISYLKQCSSHVIPADVIDSEANRLIAQTRRAGIQLNTSRSELDPDIRRDDKMKDDVYELALDKMIKDGLNVSLNKYEGKWVTIKYPWHVLAVMETLFKNIEQRIDPTVKVAKTAVVEGTVIIEAGAKIFEGAVIKGPCYIGKNCIIGSNSLVRESILGEGCVTGFNTEIARSYVGSNSWFHTNYVGDCVIEGDFGMGSGAVLANLRLDAQTIKVGDPSEKIDTHLEKLGLIAGRGVRIGVNASTMPGVRVGAGSLVGPGVVLNKDVQENTQIILKQEYLVSDNCNNKTSYDQFRDKLK